MDQNSILQKTTVAGRVSRALASALILSYQMLFRPLLPSSCRYKISCSDFTLIAIRHYGAWKGMKMGLGRVLSCHPFAKINPS